MNAESERRAERAAYRRFVRTHHPDVGGDPEAFIAGLAEFQRDLDQPSHEDADDRFAAPVVFVTRPRGWRRVLGSLRRVGRRRLRRVR